MKREKREWNKQFLEYMTIIVRHRNYIDMPNKFYADGRIRWVSPSDVERGIWWDNKVREMSERNRAEVARRIHPKELHGLKPCQICGKKLSIFYIYPTKHILDKLDELTGIRFSSYNEDIYKIFDILMAKFGKSTFSFFSIVFGIPESINLNKSSYLDYVTDSRKGLSPGVMSNPPDRLDGFHTYNACCRSMQDTGRHTDNLQRYGQDRRAYENWAEGDWNLSNRLMNEFKRYIFPVECSLCGKMRKVSADHIGPISCGFTHRAKFNPLCGRCNSKKNNRMTLRDIQILLADEKAGELVVSWHSKYLWDKLKLKIQNDNDAKELSKMMRKNLHSVLSLLFMIKNSHRNSKSFLLSLLHPEYSFFDYMFENFNPSRLYELKTIKISRDSKNRAKNAERYIRISFEGLEQYSEKSNRNVGIDEEELKGYVKSLLPYIASENMVTAKQALASAIEDIGNKIIFESNRKR